MDTNECGMDLDIEEHKTPTLLRDPSQSDPLPPESSTVYFQTLKEFLFDTTALAKHRLRSEVGSLDDMQKMASRYNKELKVLSSSLTCENHGAIFVRMDSDRMDLMSALVSGTTDTPYANGLYLFDIACPADYPMSPPKVSLATTGRGKVRFNPNLYDDGFVCLSIINTWDGDESERWNPAHSNILQVVLSIQVLVMDNSVIQKEPDYESFEIDSVENILYSNIVKYNNVKYAMIEMMQHPPEAFKEVVWRHFSLKKQEIVEQMDAWIAQGFEDESKIDYDKADFLVADHNPVTLGLFKAKSYYKLMQELKYTLVEELRKLPDIVPVPEGILDLPQLFEFTNFKYFSMAEAGGFRHSLVYELGLQTEESKEHIKNELRGLKDVNFSPHKVFIAADPGRNDLLKVLISGGPNSNYALGLFLFEIGIPSEYPQVPPKVRLVTTGENKVNFGSGLSQRGEVGHVILKDWSSNYTLCDLIQCLSQLLEENLGEEDGSIAKQTYMDMLKYATLKYCCLEMGRHPPIEFKQEIRDYFRGPGSAVDSEASTWLDKVVVLGNQDFSDALLPNEYLLSIFRKDGLLSLAQMVVNEWNNYVEYLGDSAEECGHYWDDDQSMGSVGSVVLVPKPN